MLYNAKFSPSGGGEEKEEKEKEKEKKERKKKKEDFLRHLRWGRQVRGLPG